MARPNHRSRVGSSQRPERAVDDLVRARTSFLVDHAVEAGTVRDTILASWTRSQEWDVATDDVELSCEYDRDPDSPLTRAAKPVIADIADQLATEPVSVILTDADGVVLERRTGDSTLNQHLDKVWLAPGFSYAERYIGTNGIGTALEGRGPVQVYGHEHYVENLADLACAGAPIWHPVTGKLMGVIDLTCWRPDAGRFMAMAVSRIARQIEGSLLDQSGPRELALLHDYLTACQRGRGAVLGVSPDLVMMNDKARELIDPSDQVALVAGAMEALNSPSRLTLVDLPSGSVARVQGRASWTERGGAGGVLHVQLAAPDPTPSAHATTTLPQLALPAAVGSGLRWMKCCQAVDRHFQNREWVVLEGEPGTGKTTVARATHQARTPAAHLRVLDADDYGARWVADIIEELETGGGTLVITHVDRLPAEGRQALADALEPHRESTDPERPWVVATVDAGRGPAELLELFPRTVPVPPLRHHVEDVAELVPHLLARLTRGHDLTCSPDALRVLMRNRWPGNVEQLYHVLRKTVARRRAGELVPADLPAEARAVTRRVLTPLEAIECDAIVDALLDNAGNKAEAARQLGMSRATIYRKIRGYGISVPGPAAGGRG
ncbi:sigma-54-dependent Fis family transcriptional regulator [Pseudonocardia humida]|uniref:GAF domain-containing protein n=1 Tax=Pseudonocardia humida TaxID=2800819 RepID=A0ABT1A2N9_9PSEU|nr:helix-turn-helix domain-containing protein [Pseudonocardia humida]MCO1657283.1 GAF domain-containing protein [Pseudonocardia humida]